MEFDKIIQLIKTVSDSNLTQFSMEEGSLKISMKTNKQTKIIAAPMMAPALGPDMGPAAGSPAMQNFQSQAGPAQTEVTFQEAEETILSGNVVKSPLVGTFYNASSPDAEAFVKVGDTVKKGQVLGIVEAMKLMNEIESEFDGTVEQILVENEEVVEYGQPLFVIR
ncbi:acetyl-CoA carboxylase biotin carboxyl carrier protein [Blautia marasmi]|uniref:acetyl-CoA carboxylase biotin carboxyl carrier protein n=1 Tax=Blautia marasmi TaxID=1917868 RepID=UPI001D06ED6B|nr:acetyl-CoA carboxylase biotin carboxyl carrier protein [Blautia marasmi]MCB6192390.1 acetyl-CoA carboxylase biotin carboxyl carrier protein [Blautia marasmi]